MDGKKSRNKLLAHLLQGAEAALLRSLVVEFGPSMVLLQHDGFASQSRLDVPALEESMYRQTGFRMQVSEQRLMLPASFHDSNFSRIGIGVSEGPFASADVQRSLSPMQHLPPIPAPLPARAPSSVHAPAYP